MKKYLGLVIIVISFLIGVIGVKVVILYREKQNFSHNYLRTYLEIPRKFQGLPTKVRVIKPNETQFQTVNLYPNKWTLILYFRVDDCGICLQELKAMKDTFDLNLQVLIATDHPVSWEVKCILQDFSLKEAIWDNVSTLLGSRVRYTPTYFLIKGKKIKELGTIAQLKETNLKEGAFAHLLKEEFKKYDF